MTFFGHYDPSVYGWSADSSQIVPFAYKGQNFPSGAHRLAVPVFTAILDKLVAAGLKVPTGAVMVAGNWGFEARNVRGSSSLSFHAFGTAIDVDAPHNGMSYSHPPPTTFPGSTNTICQADGAEWGGAWNGRTDPMHVELHMTPDECRAFHPSGGTQAPSGTPGQPTLHQGSTGAPVAVVQRRINLRPSVHPAYGPATVAGVKMYQARHKITADGICGPSTWSRLMTANILPGERITFLGCTGPDVAWLQRRLKLTPAKHPAFGPKTEAAVKAWQKKVGLKADGLVSIQTWAKLGANG
jgi:hypothetical protein